MEFVYVVPRTVLFPEFTPHGLQPFGAELSEEGFVDVVREAGFFVEREHAERTPTLKQVIPYTVVCRPTEREPEVFLLRRRKAGGEARLHGKLSIGVGGHLNPIDAEGSDGARRDPLRSGARRELLEELSFGAPDPNTDPADELVPWPVGILNDDTNSVGAVHVGVVQLLVTERPVSVRETEHLEGGFVPLSELAAHGERGAGYETWSALLLPLLPSLVGAVLDRSDSRTANSRTANSRTPSAEPAPPRGAPTVPSSDAPPSVPRAPSGAHAPTGAQRDRTVPSQQPPRHDEVSHAHG